MIRPLRKKHLQVWVVLTVLLPLGIVAAYRSVPPPLIEPRELLPSGTVFPFIGEPAMSEDHAVPLRNNADRQEQLDRILKNPLPVPSAFVYCQSKKSRQPADENKLNGVAGSKETRVLDPHQQHYMVADEIGTTFLLHDAVHSRRMMKAEFKK